MTKKPTKKPTATSELDEIIAEQRRDMRSTKTRRPSGHSPHSVEPKMGTGAVIRRRLGRYKATLGELRRDPEPELNEALTVEENEEAHRAERGRALAQAQMIEAAQRFARLGKVEQVKRKLTRDQYLVMRALAASKHVGFVAESGRTVWRSEPYSFEDIAAWLKKPVAAVKEIAARAVERMTKVRP
jgi:hypothetical protein